jgi:hypothetical protein
MLNTIQMAGGKRLRSAHMNGVIGQYPLKGNFFDGVLSSAD